MIKRIFILFFLLSCLYLNNAVADNISIFPLNNYNQNISHWINSNDPDYAKPLMPFAMQKERYDIFLNHYFGTRSPWHADYIRKIFSETGSDSIKNSETSVLATFDNEDKNSGGISYGENYIPYDKKWINSIAANIDMTQLSNLVYSNANRAIAMNNVNVRALPTNDVSFYDRQIAGQGYPFDNLQVSSLWVGTPLYIVSETKDKTWSLVIGPDYIGWVPSNDIARVNDQFILTWRQHAMQKMAAITRVSTPIYNQAGTYLFSTYIGSSFPVVGETSQNLTILVPHVDQNHNAVMLQVHVAKRDAIVMPLVLTKANFSQLMQSLIGRPYGWGGMYFYNDCSQELKSLFAPFGIYLPRHSSAQVNEGKVMDLTASSASERLTYLMQHGVPFLTVVYLGGHIILYLGNYSTPQGEIALTYQNMWGLSPNPPNSRAVIGRAVLLPMLLSYPEDPTLVSQANKKYFQIGFLNKLPQEPDNLNIDIHSLMVSDSPSSLFS